MHINVDQRAHRIIVSCSGALDAVSAPMLEAAVLPAFEAGRGPFVTLVLLDLVKVHHLSSAGIRSLMVLIKAARQARANVQGNFLQFRVCRASPGVQRVLEMVNLWGALTERTPVSGRQAAHRPDAGADYRAVVSRVRDAFGPPIPDPARDGLVNQAITQALDRLSGSRTGRSRRSGRCVEAPIGVERASLPLDPAPVGETLSRLIDRFDGLPIVGHPRYLHEAVGPTGIPAMAGQLVAAVLKPDLLDGEAGQALRGVEREVIDMCADLVGYDPASAGGVFTCGGAGTIIHGVRLGIEQAHQGAFRRGLGCPMAVVASDVESAARRAALGWLGLGTDSLVTVATDEDNSMRLDDLEATLRRLVDQGVRIACVVTTMGGAGSFGVDNLDFVVQLRDELVAEYGLPYRPHVHADAAIGWAWAVFNGYDFEVNPLDFPPATLRSLWDVHAGIRRLKLADSVGIDFHRAGYAPYPASLLLCRERELMDPGRDRAATGRVTAGEESIDPACSSMEGVSPAGPILAAWANLVTLGRGGFRALLGHAVTVAEALRSRLDSDSHTCVVNDYNYGPVTLFRAYPAGVDAREAYLDERFEPAHAPDLLVHNDYNRRLAGALARAGKSGDGVTLSLVDCYRRTRQGTPIVALRSAVMSPFATEESVGELLQCIDAARQEIA
ncbi:MAG: STAS domain-containing protein [Candidatus Riflebacteria bacterium]|nr:STAS domain-containing protein [Candidatus Riflebacteria bacterium]